MSETASARALSRVSGSCVQEAPEALDAVRDRPSAGPVAAIESLRVAAIGRLCEPFTHELRNALTGARCFLDLVAEVELPPALGGFFSDLEASTERISRLAERFHALASSRSATGDPSTELRRLVELVNMVGLGRRLAMEESYQADLAKVALEPRLLQTALLVALTDLLALRPSRLRVSTASEAGEIVVRLQALGCDRPDAVPESSAVLGGATGCVVTRCEDGYEIRLPVDGQAVAGTVAPGGSWSEPSPAAR